MFCSYCVLLSSVSSSLFIWPLSSDSRSCALLISLLNSSPCSSSCFALFWQSAVSSSSSDIFCSVSCLSVCVFSVRSIMSFFIFPEYEIACMMSSMFWLTAMAVIVSFDRNEVYSLVTIDDSLVCVSWSSCFICSSSSSACLFWASAFAASDVSWMYVLCDSSSFSLSVLISSKRSAVSLPYAVDGMVAVSISSAMMILAAIARSLSDVALVILRMIGFASPFALFLLSHVVAYRL